MISLLMYRYIMTLTAPSNTFIMRKLKYMLDVSMEFI